jgi:hypothetical protein
MGLLQFVVVAILAVAGATLLAKRIERRLPRVRPAGPRVES